MCLIQCVVQLLTSKYLASPSLPLQARLRLSDALPAAPSIAPTTQPRKLDRVSFSSFDVTELKVLSFLFFYQHLELPLMLIAPSPVHEPPKSLDDRPLDHHGHVSVSLIIDIDHNSYFFV